MQRPRACICSSSFRWEHTKQTKKIEESSATLRLDSHSRQVCAREIQEGACRHAHLTGRARRTVKTTISTVFQMFITSDRNVAPFSGEVG